MNTIFFILILLIIIAICSEPQNQVEAVAGKIIRQIINRGRQNAGKSWVDKIRSSRNNNGQNNRQVQKVPQKVQPKQNHKRDR